jgi:hypothetical protein
MSDSIKEIEAEFEKIIPELKSGMRLDMAFGLILENLKATRKELDFIKAARDKCQKTICEDCGSLLQRF